MVSTHTTFDIWPHSPLYETILEDARGNPAPNIGSPTLIWHFAIWPREMPGEKQPSGAGQASRLDPHAQFRRDFEDFDKDRQAFLDEIFQLTGHLQKRGSVPGTDLITPEIIRPSEVSLDLVQLPHDTTSEYHFVQPKPASFAFTIWWRDGEFQPEGSNRSHPSPSDIRVRVHVGVHVGHATVTFYLDVGKPFDEKQLFEVPNLPGDRRGRVARHLEAIRDSSEDQIRSFAIDREKLPEENVSPEEARALQEAADYLYDGIWQEFATSFGLTGLVPPPSPRQDARQLSERFADFRALIMSMRGLETAQNDKQKAVRRDLIARNGLDDSVTDELEREANVGLGRFSRFDAEAGEPNAVLKSLWPFLRRTTPNADFRDFVGCGILENRAVYTTALGGLQPDQSSTEWAESPLLIDPDRENRRDKNAGPLSLRYLVVTKGEPHRKQIGRFVDRINAIGTYRLFAIKNIANIRNASIHLRLLGRRLDGVIQRWGDKRQTIEKEFSEQEQALRRRYGNPRFDYQKKGKSREQRRADRFHRELDEINYQRAKNLADLISETERELIALSAQLDYVGQGGAGRLLYVINRADYYMSEYERLFPMLEIENIDGWINYEQFYLRDVKPAFDFIRNVSRRLVSFRERLQSVTDMIQTSSLIVEAAETRQNTDTLKRIVGEVTRAQTLATFAAAPLILLVLNEIAKEPVLIIWLIDLIRDAYTDLVNAR